MRPSATRSVRCVAPDPAQLDAARALVAAALRVATDRIGAATAMFGVPVWDSFGQLSVILAIEEAIGARIEDADLFNRLTSVPQIAAFLAERAETKRHAEPPSPT
ncbi:MAG: hypothetical protein QOD93_7412 [Acetobacteraceae bacterium]|nr:hypothetical protein [Acetobacteraceae bacterium]